MEKFTEQFEENEKKPDIDSQEFSGELQEGEGALDREVFESFRETENAELSSLESREGEGKISKLKKAFLAITAGVMLMNAAPAFAGELQKGGPVEQQHIEVQSDFNNYEIAGAAMPTLEKWGWKFFGNSLQMGEKGSFDFQTPDISHIRELKKISVFDVDGGRVIIRVEYKDGSEIDFQGIDGELTQKN